MGKVWQYGHLIIPNRTQSWQLAQELVRLQPGRLMSLFKMLTA